MLKKTAIPGLLIAAVLMLSACSAITQREPTSTSAPASAQFEEAQETLLAYFAELHAGEYDAAASRYGGDLAVLSEWNPAIDAADKSALLKAACTRQLVCLPVRSIISADQIDTSTYSFSVEYSNPDGSLFTLGPCCGATETEMPPVSEFDCTVKKTDQGGYVVLCLPEYVP